MLLRKLILSLSVIATLFLVSCATTHISVKYPGASIYDHEKKIGTGSASVTRTGFPHRMRLTAKMNGEEIGSVKVARRFTFITLLTALVTDGIGVPFTFQYPRNVIIPVKPGFDPYGNKKSPWDEPLKGKW
jgi:hypothetical protein